MSTTRTVGVFRDRTAASHARAAVADVAPDVSIHVDSPDGDLLARTAESQAEMRHAGPMPATPVMTASAAKSSFAFAIIGALIGAVIFLPLGFIEFSDMALGWRLLTAALAGFLAGLVGGWLSGGYLGATVSTKPLAVDRGITVTVDSDDGRVSAAMLEHDPIRIDLVDRDGQLVSTTAAEEYHTDTYTERLGRAYAGHDNPDELTDADTSKA